MRTSVEREERSGDEVRFTWGWSDDGHFTRVRTAPASSAARNPAFDVTPAALVRGIITEKGVVANGREYELDCLIYASGFEVGTDYSRRAGLEIVGRGGQTLTEKWADGVRSVHGMHVNGFPNCFLMTNAQAGFTANYPHLSDEQAQHIGYIVAHSREAGIEVVEATPEGETAWVEHCLDKARDTGDFFENCTPGYYNNEGNTSEISAQNGFYGGGSPAFFQLLKAWREAGDLDGLETR